MIGNIFRIIAEIALAAAIALLLRRYVAGLIWVKGNSMAPTLRNGDFLLAVMCRLSRRPLRRGDVVICHYPGRGRKYFVKRVVGLPGDEVCRFSGVTMLNGDSLDARAMPLRRDYAHTLGEEEYFCVGDNRAGSHDSRDWQRPGANLVGPVRRDEICGVVKYVFWPPSRWRKVSREFAFEGVQPVIAPETPEDEGDKNEGESEIAD